MLNRNCRCVSFIAVFLTARLFAAEPAKPPAMLWGDTSRLGRPFSKDPSVIRFGGRYLLYYSMPPFADGRPDDGWAVGIAESSNLIDWKKAGEILPATDYERKGLCSPFAKVLNGSVHLLYQTYGGGPKDAICHAVSSDGLNFQRDPRNPVYRASGDWNSGRAIDAEAIQFHNRWFLFAATRDPRSRIQMLVAATSDAGFDQQSWSTWTTGPILKPELPWEKNCIEAPAVIRRGRSLILLYGGAYNNAPQQIGAARSSDGFHWTRLADEPFLPVGKPGTWNSSESGHPAIFQDDDRKTYLFFQGNNDNGHTWLLSFKRIGWRAQTPFLLPD